MTSRLAALSASRIKDYLQCPLLFRFRMIDRLPEPPSPAAFKGTLVHSVLEKLFDLPPEERNVNTALALVGERWQVLSETTVFLDEILAQVDASEFIASAQNLVRSYFALETPSRLAPSGQEVFLESTWNSLRLRGCLDRIEVASDGSVRIVDYKTGKAPSPRFMNDALFQMRFYALLYSQSKGILPTRLQLLYLGDKKVLSWDPTDDHMQSFNLELLGIWAQIRASLVAADFPARSTRLCDWCHFQKYCPAYGGQCPALKPTDIERVSQVSTVGL